MNYVAERRRPMPQAHFATDRLTLPWPALEDAHSKAAIILPWLAMVAILLLAALPDFLHRPDMPIGRINALSDIPLVALVTPLDLVFSRLVAETIATLAVPFAQLLIALALVRGTLRCLEFTGAAANIGLLIVPLLPIAVAVFAPTHSGSHGWEALCVLAILRLLVDRRAVVAKAALAGAVAGLLVSFSLAGFVVATAAAGLLALLYLRDGDARCLAAYAAALAIAASVVYAATQPLANWSLPRVDWISWPHLAGCWAAASAAIMLSMLSRPAPPIVRVGGIAIVACAACAIPLALFGQAMLRPLTASSLLIDSGSGWHDAIGMALATLVLWLAGVTTRWRQLSRSGNPRGWLAVVVVSGVAVLLALVTDRAALFAQLLAIPLFALLLRDALRVASRMGSAPLRVSGIALALFVLTPTGGSVIGGLASSLAQGRAITWPAPVSQAASSIATIVQRA